MEQGFRAPDVACCGTLQDSVPTLSAALDLRTICYLLSFINVKNFTKCDVSAWFSPRKGTKKGIIYLHNFYRGLEFPQTEVSCKLFLKYYMFMLQDGLGNKNTKWKHFSRDSRKYLAVNITVVNTFRIRVCIQKIQDALVR
jgi:hypothetical protein